MERLTKPEWGDDTPHAPENDSDRRSRRIGWSNGETNSAISALSKSANEARVALAQVREQCGRENMSPELTRTQLEATIGIVGDPDVLGRLIEDLRWGTVLDVGDRHEHQSTAQMMATHLVSHHGWRHDLSTALPSMVTLERLHQRGHQGLDG